MSQRQSSTSSLQIPKATFLPMLCSRPSIKSVTIPRPQDPSSLSLQDQDQDQEDPLSPKISCIGQVKRNNKITNLPTSLNNKPHFTTPNHHHNHQNHYFNLKRLFSAKTLTVSVSVSAAAFTVTTKSGNTTTDTNSPRRGEGGGRRRRTRRRSREELVRIEVSKNDDDNIDNKGFVLNVVDMDPPLPVVRKKQDGGGDKAQENLWRRRSRGLELTSLEIHKNMTHQTKLVTTV